MDTDTSSRRAAVTKASNGSGTFLGWIGAEVASYGLVAASASDQQSPTCSWVCFSDRELLVFLGLAFGLWILPGQLVFGLALTARYHRDGKSPSTAGTVAYFATVLIAVVIIGAIMATQQ